LRQYKSRRWRLSDKKQILVKHHRERPEVALLFQEAARQETLTVERLEEIAATLKRARWNPEEESPL